MQIRKVFLSSTAKDLQEYREAAYRAIEGLDGYHCIRMENFGARDHEADKFCAAKVAECDLFVGILGHLYGGCPKGSETSYTEMEYNTALDASKPRLIFVAPEDFPILARLRESDDKREKQKSFRELVNKDRISADFSSPDNLALKVTQAIQNVIMSTRKERTSVPLQSPSLSKLIIGQEQELQALISNQISRPPVDFKVREEEVHEDLIEFDQIASRTTINKASCVDFLLVTTLAEERDAVLDKLPGYQKLPPSRDDIHTCFKAELPVIFPNGKTCSYRVIVMPLLGMGRVQAATATVEAIKQWHPRYIVLIGIAGGMAAQGVKIGDILIADQIVDYELQKLSPQGPQIRWDVHRADPRLLSACNNITDESWQKLLRNKPPGGRKPRRHNGPIASGDKVVAIGDILKQYQEIWPKLIGVEMEAAGAATAAFQSSERSGFFMVRCVSDLADEQKGSAKVKKWRSYACDAAAAFAISFLSGGPIPLQEGSMSIEGINVLQKQETYKQEEFRNDSHRKASDMPLDQSSAKIADSKIIPSDLGAKKSQKRLQTAVNKLKYKKGDIVEVTRIADPNVKRGASYFMTDDGFGGLVVLGSSPFVEIGQKARLEINGVMEIEGLYNFSAIGAKREPALQTRNESGRR